MAGAKAASSFHSAVIIVSHAALLPQDMYVYSERVAEHTALSEAARVRSEVTLVNNSGRRWQGTLRFALQLDNLEISSSAPLKQAQPGGQKCNSADHDFDMTRGGQQQSSDSMAKRGQLRQDIQRWGCGMAKQRNKLPHSTSQQPIHGENALQWTEAVEAPPGRTSFKFKDQVLRNPQLWWPINLGKQARLGTINQYLVLPFRIQEPCACMSSAQPASKWHACTPYQSFLAMKNVLCLVQSANIKEVCSFTSWLTNKVAHTCAERRPYIESM